MANIRSAKKRVRKAARQTQVNRMRLSRVRGFITKVEEAIAGDDKKAAAAALKVAQPEMMRGASKRVLHKNTVSRKLARLSTRIKAL